MKTLSDELYRKILDANIDLHIIEAPYYERLHPEEFNWFEQAHITRDLKFIRERLSVLPSALDMGCGTGNIALKLLEMGFEVWGVDMSEEMLRVLRKKIPVSSQGKVRLACKNIDLFLDDCTEKFDLVAVSSVLHHLPEYIGTFKRAIGLLKPGGCIYVTHEPTKGALGPDRFLRKILWQADNIAYSILNLGRKPRTQNRNYRYSDYQLYHGFDEERVVSVCRDEGLQVVKFKRYASAMRLGASCWIDSVLLKSKSQFCLMAIKPANACPENNVLCNKKLTEFYNHDKHYGAVSNDIIAGQYGIKDGKVTGPIVHYFMHDKLLAMVRSNIPEKATLLDVGCGMGILAETLRGNTGLYVGVDISIERIKQCRQRIKADRTFFVAADAARLPFESESFNTVASIEVIEHVADTGSFLKQISGVLVKGGVFILSAPGNLIFENNVNLLYKEPHLYEFTPRKLKKMLEKAGFSIISIEGVGFKLPKIKIPVWMGSDIIKYVYKNTRKTDLRAGYGIPISLQFDLITNSLFRKLYLRSKWKKPFLVIMEILNFIGKHIPELSSEMVIVCRK
ncbi:MAG: methyltransferase domain-containing protein [Candidatus Omnitrophica bacterium]|nr:methyltransferase domain-containing protein [Candidatus Omnitrophota bacterium]